MVKKLFKHEILAYLRVWIPMQIILLGIALLGRIVQFFEPDPARVALSSIDFGATAYNIVHVSSIIAFVVAIVAAVGLAFVFSIVRFYKNLFSGEGYLSFTLPVTPTAHIVVKAAIALLFQVATWVVVFLAFGVITAGDVFLEVMRAVGYLWGRAVKVLAFHWPLYVAECLLALLLLVLSEYLLYYACIAVGQTARKNRVLAAVGVYFAYYMATQVIATVLIVLITVFYEWLPIAAIENFLICYPEASTHIILWLIILFAAVLCAVYFFVTRFIIRRKLNLE